MSSQPPKNNRKRPGHDPRGFVIGSAIGANAGVSDWYARRVVGLYEGMSEDTINEVADLFEKAGRYGRLEVNSLSSQARILLNRLSGNFAAAFTSRGKILSVSLVKRSLAANSAGMRESLKDMAQGFSIKPTWISGALKEKLKAAVTENVSLITSIQQRYHAQVTEAVMRAITTGRGIKDLVPELQSIGGVSARRARFIATDQSRKAAGMITGERFKSAGVKYFQWIHSGRATKPRPLHEAFHGRIFEVDNPPVIDQKTGERGLPGQLINCRCRMAPALDKQFWEQEAGEDDEH